MRVVARKLLILLLALQTGCFSYVPVGGSALPQGTTVRAELRDPIDVRLTEVAVPNTTFLVGEVIGQSPDTLLLSVMSLRSASGYSLTAQGETLRLPAVGVLRLEQRRLDGLRTAALVAGITVAIGALIAAWGGELVGGGGGTPKPNPQ